MLSMRESKQLYQQAISFPLQLCRCNRLDWIITVLQQVAVCSMPHAALTGNSQLANTHSHCTYFLIFLIFLICTITYKFCGVSSLCTCTQDCPQCPLCVFVCCRVRRRLRRAHKRFPADPPQCVLANESYDDTEEEVYSKPNRGMGGYEPAVKPVLIFRNDSSGDMLAYDMFMAGTQ